MRPIDTRRVERMLRRAYEVQEKQTLSRPSSDGIRSGTVDNFGMSADTLRLLEAVDTLKLNDKLSKLSVGGFLMR